MTRPDSTTRTIEFGPIAGAYERGRVLSDGAFAAWREAIEPHVRTPLDAPILDLGCGTGMWSTMLAQWFDASVLGVEPAPGMLAQARESHADLGVAYLCGDAEHLPLRDRSGSLAWLSTVIHHIGDLAAAARELRRVLLPGAPVLIRNAFPDGLTDLGVHAKFFPGALRVIDRFPSIEEARCVFRDAGFALEAQQSVAQESVPSLAIYLGRVRSRADTTLALISDEEFAKGIDALEDAAAAETTPQPVIHHLGLLVLR